MNAVKLFTKHKPHLSYNRTDARGAEISAVPAVFHAWENSRHTQEKSPRNEFISLHPTLTSSDALCKIKKKKKKTCYFSTVALYEVAQW